MEPIDDPPRIENVNNKAPTIFFKANYVGVPIFLH
jgi:hypothetical protein